MVLTFARPTLSREQEARFRAAITNRVAPFAGIASLAAAASFVLFVAWDYSIDPTAPSRTWPIRLSAALCFLALATLLLSRAGDRIVTAVLVGGFLTAAVHASLVFSRIPDGLSLGIPGLILGLIFLPALTRRLREAGAVLAANYAGAIGTMALCEATPVQLVNASIWLAGASTFTLLFCILVDRANRREFALIETLAEERQRADDLLLCILPREAAEHLKASSGVISYYNDNATVVFADLIGFTALTKTLSPDELVGMLDDLFGRFDDLCLSCGMEKIKTIGDAYMAVAGVPIGRDDHAEVAARFAQSILAEARAFRVRSGLPIRLRVGMHSGPLVSGVIGKSKFAFDVWGETVNTASRLETHGVPDAVQMSEATAALLSAAFKVAPRGTVELRGLGQVPAYVFVDEECPSPSGELGKTPLVSAGR